MGLPEPSLTTITKTFSLLSHCKVSCGSPCCTELCVVHTEMSTAIVMKML